MIILPNNTLCMNLCLPSNPSLLLVEEEAGADLYDTHMMLSLRYWALVLDTRSLLSDNHKGGRELGMCPASIILNVRKGNSTHHFTPHHTVHFCVCDAHSVQYVT